MLFQKQYGSRDEVEDVILQERRQHLEKLIAQDPSDYELWFDRCNLEEQVLNN